MPAHRPPTATVRAADNCKFGQGKSRKKASSACRKSKKHTAPDYDVCQVARPRADSSEKARIAFSSLRFASGLRTRFRGSPHLRRVRSFYAPRLRRPCLRSGGRRRGLVLPRVRRRCVLPRACLRARLTFSFDKGGDSPRKFPSMTVKATRSRACTGCAGCRAEACGNCRYCLDKPRFGGPNSLKRRCTERTCRQAVPPVTSDTWRADLCALVAAKRKREAAAARNEHELAAAKSKQEAARSAAAARNERELATAAEVGFFSLSFSC